MFYFINNNNIKYYKIIYKINLDYIYIIEEGGKKKN